jgi:glycolate oxidase
MENLAEHLYSIIGDRKRVLVGEEIEIRFLSDVMGRTVGTADAVVLPLSVREVSDVMKYAYENNIPVTPRGAGTNLVGSTVPLKGGIVLDLSLMNRILEFDYDSMTVTVEPGILLSEVQSFVESKGLFYPPDPGERNSSIGGNISTNAGGMRAVKYGVTRDYVRGLEVVLADGEIMTIGSKNVKDSSGLSLKNLIIGSEGTLAVITKCILRLVPKPENSVSIILAYATQQEGTKSVLKILHENINPTAVEFIERSVAVLGENYTGTKLPSPNAGAYVLIILDGEKEDISNRMSVLERISHETGALSYTPLDSEYAAEVWRMRGAFQKAVEAFSEQEPVDVVVPINKTAEFIQFVHEHEADSGIKIYCFGHAGDGNIHLSMLREKREQEVWNEERRAALYALFSKAKELGGLTSGEHGIGISKQEYYLSVTDKVNLKTMNNIKNALDERHILNPGKVYHKL